MPDRPGAVCGYGRFGTGNLCYSSASGRPSAFGLEQNYPNPFNPATRLRFSVGTAGDQSHSPCRVQLAVYDLIGRRVAVLADGPMEPGDYQVTWDAGMPRAGCMSTR